MSKRPPSLVLVVVYKAVMGTLEIISGVLIFIFSFLAGKIGASDWVQGIIAHELAQDPQDRFINWLTSLDLHSVQVFSLRLGIFIFFLGVIKIILAIGVWKRSMLVRNIGLWFFLGLGLFGVYDIIAHFSIFKCIALLLDLFILYYFWKILPRHIKIEVKEMHLN